MIGGILIQSKRYYCLDYFSVSLMTIGLIWFTSIDRSLNTEFNVTGVILISMALCVDAFLGNFQEKVMRDYRMSQAELMTYSYTFGTCLLVSAVFYNGSMSDAIAGVKEAAPLSIYLIVGLTMCGFLGINFVMTLVKVSKTGFISNCEDVHWYRFFRHAANFSAQPRHSATIFFIIASKICRYNMQPIFLK